MSDLTAVERSILEKVLRMDGGYVLKSLEPFLR